MYNFQFLFIEVKRRSWWKWEWWRKRTKSDSGGWSLEIILIFINIHSLSSWSGAREREWYHSFGNVKINIINDIRFIIVFICSFLRSIYIYIYRYIRTRTYIDGWIREWKSQPLWHLLDAQPPPYPTSLKSNSLTIKRCTSSTIMLPSKPDKKMENFFSFSLLIALIKSADKREETFYGDHIILYVHQTTGKTGEIYENFNKWTLKYCRKFSFTKQRKSWKRRRG